MADRKISQFSEITTITDNQCVPVVDITETQEVDRNKIIKYLNLLRKATSSLHGVVRLTGDLGGTADSPTVPGLANKANINSPNFTGTPTTPTPLNDNQPNQIVNIDYLLDKIELFYSDTLIVYLDGVVREKEYVLVNKFTYPIQVNSLSVSTRVGTCTFSLNKNGTPFSNSTNLNVNTLVTSYNFTPVLSFQNNNTLSISFDNVDLAQDLTLNINYVKV